MKHFAGFHLINPAGLLHIAVPDTGTGMVLTYSTVRICRIEVAVESVSHQFHTVWEVFRLSSAGKDLLPGMSLQLGHRGEVDDLIVLFEELVFYKSEQDFVFPALTSVAMFLYAEYLLKSGIIKIES
jgi:hypothetical protein